MNDYWHRQKPAKPLFPDMLWSRPETKAFAGKLLIIGGNAQGFATPAEAYAEAQKAGIGTARVLLPDSLHKTLGKTFDAGEFAPSTPSGSFAQKSLAEWLDMAMWADGVLLSGDLGRNSETAIVLEKFLTKFKGKTTISGDGLDYLLTAPLATMLLMRPDTLIVANFSQLQKLFTAARSPRPITSDMDLIRYVEALHGFSLQHHAAIISDFQGSLFLATEGEVVDQPDPSVEAGDWQTTVAAHAAVWWLQNPTKQYQALASSLLRAVD